MPLTQQQHQQAERLRIQNARVSVMRQVREAERHAHRFRHHERRIADLTQEAKHLNTTNAEFENLNPVRSAQYAIIAVLALAAYAVDLALYRPVSQFFTGQDLLPSGVKWFFTFAMPAGILIIELGICAHRTHHSELHARQLEGPGAFTLWTLFSLLMNIVIPSAVVGTFMAGYSDLSPAIRNVMLVSLGVLAFVSHGAIIWGGNLAIEAKGFVSFRIQRRLQRGEIDREQCLLNEAEQAARDGFGTFVDARDLFNAEAPASLRIGAPLLDAVTVEVLNRIYGRQVIQEPGAPAENTPGQGSSPEPAPSPQATAPSARDAKSDGDQPPQPADRVDEQNDNRSNPPASPSGEEGRANGEMDYLRTVLSRHVRESEGEVK